MVHDVLMINYEQRSLLNHSKANMALATVAFSGLASAGTAYLAGQTGLTEADTKEQSARLSRRYEVILMWAALVLGTLILVLAFRTLTGNTRWLYLTYYPEANHTISIKAVCLTTLNEQFET